MMPILKRALLLCLLLAGIPAAQAIPAFAEQTGQPCAQCHVGAFGPQLKPYGRDFKLYGYTATDGEHHLPGLALTMQSGLTHTSAAQTDNKANFGLKDNDNLVLDQQVSAYFGGHIAKEIGAFVQVTYDGTAARWSWDNIDLRFAHETRLLGKDAVVGLTLNNSPTIQDGWNSTPTWGFPYNSSSIAKTPAAAALVDGGLDYQVLGLGGYLLWNDHLFAELTAYRALNDAMLNHLGSGSNAAGGPLDVYDGTIPYWRLALYHETDDHYFEVGAFGLAAARFPGGDRSAGTTDRVRDRALDANYQYKGSDDHYVSAHAVYLSEKLDLRAGRLLGTAGSSDLSLQTFRADVSYSYRNTWTPTVQYFHTVGGADAYWGVGDSLTNPAGSPNSRGWVFDLGFVPMGKAESSTPWANMRVGLQLIQYTAFDGSAVGASSHDTLYLSLWFALSPTYAYESRH
jgi:hypothetical protein